jgi:hypothetical protein
LPAGLKEEEEQRTTIDAKWNRRPVEMGKEKTEE